MKRERLPVIYSYEHGDESLPHLRDLVSDTPDPMKGKILGYLRTHCIWACPGIIMDEINPEFTIGSGNTYSDGTYFWNDEFINYVDRYNIPVPEIFRNHILENFDQRMKRHALLNLIDRVEIHNNPHLDYMWSASIEKSGMIRYQNNTDCQDGVFLTINSEDADWIVHPIMEELFCYDADDHGEAIFDGYHWEILFFRKDELMDKIEGWPHEDKWRYRRFKDIVEFTERYIKNDLGSGYMNFYKDSDEEDDFY